MCSVMLYGSKTWDVKDDDVKRLVCTEKSKVHWICSATVTDSQTCEKMRSRLWPELQ